MGKKNSKKKGTPSKKEDAVKKPAETAASESEKEVSKSTSKSKVTAKPKSPAMAKPMEENISENLLILKQFETWTPDQLYVPPVDEADGEDFTAPPFSDDEHENRRIQDLLLTPIDLSVPVSVEELLLIRFESWKPTQLYVPPADEAYLKEFTAPPFTDDERENRRMQDLVLTPIDLSVPIPVEDLLQLRFESWKPTQLYAPPADAAYLKGFAAPPFSDDERENRRIQDLLLSPIDLSVPIPVEDLLQLRFESWKPTQLYAPPADAAYLKGFAAPPFSDDPRENRRIRDLLLSPIDLRIPIPVEDLLQLRFESWEPAQRYVPPTDEAYLKGFTAPPFADDDTENQRLRARLLSPIDLTLMPEPPAAAPEPSEIPKPEKPIEAHAEISLESGQKPEDAVQGEIPKPKAEEPSQKVLVTYNDTKGDESVDKTLKYFIGIFVVLAALIIGASVSNSGKYYVKTKGNAVEIWKGVFAPMGRKLVVSLPDAKIPENLSDDPYSKEEALKIPFNYFIDKADALLNTEGTPDFVAVKTCLNTAITYGITDESKKIANARLETLELLSFLFKADLAAIKGSASDLDAALASLQMALRLPLLTPAQRMLVEHKIVMIGNLKQAVMTGAVLQPPVSVPADEKKAEKPGGTIQETIQSVLTN